MVRIYEVLSSFSDRDLPEPRLTLTPIPGGDEGTRRTLKKMREIVWKSLRHPQHGPILRGTALKVLVDAGCKPKDYLCEAEALHNFVRDEIRWTRDARRHELLQWPARTLAWRAGDCDDKSMLISALALMVGFPAVAFRAIGANPAHPEEFTHVYVLLDPFGNGKWIPSDPTVSKAKLGWESPVKFRVMDLRVDR